MNTTQDHVRQPESMDIWWKRQIQPHRALSRYVHGYITCRYLDVEDYGGARNFGHLAFAVADIHAACTRLQQHGVPINRPPRDGRMAFVRSPDGISIELLQQGAALTPCEPWISMPNVGSW